MPRGGVPVTWKCRWRPNRTVPRTFNEADAARIACRVVRAGGSKAKIDAIYRTKCKDVPGKRGSEAAEALELAASNIESNQAELNETFRTFQVINGLLDALALLTLIFPITRPVRIAAQAARAVMGTRTAANIAQRAANDAAFKIVQRAAANERQFLRASGE